jgi:sigma-B regulation protein RsbU (phosphoserine phosphatase)
VASTPKHISTLPSVESNEDLSAQLQAKTLQLHWLLQITKAINHDFKAKQLFDVYEHVLHSHLKVGKLALFIREEKWTCKLLYGTDKSFEKLNLEKIINELNKLHNLEMDKELWAKNFRSSIRIVRKEDNKEQTLAYVLIDNFNESPIVNKNELIKFIETITSLIVVAIENKRIADEKYRQAAIKRELELAAQMQNMLFPVSLPDTDLVEFHASYLPHQEVGGDYYDYIQLNSNEFAFCMADVSGKGIPAALLMSNFQANLHAHLSETTSLTVLTNMLNARVYNSAKGEKFITFFIARFNTKTKELHYVNAGHNPPFLIHDKVVYMLNEGTTGLGMFEQLPFVNPGKVFIPDNALLLCYTDGVTDVENDEEMEFGVERLREFLIANHHSSRIETLHNLLIKTLISFKQARNFTDDITLLSCRFKGKKV